MSIDAVRPRVPLAAGAFLWNKILPLLRVPVVFALAGISCAFAVRP